MGDQHCQIFLKNRRYREKRQVFLRKFDRPTAAQIKVEPAGRQQLHVIDLRPALLDRDVEAVLCINSGRDRLIKAAIFGLGLPVETKGDAILGARRRRDENAENKDRGKAMILPRGARSSRALRLSRGRACIPPRRIIAAIGFRVEIFF